MLSQGQGALAYNKCFYLGQGQGALGIQQILLRTTDYISQGQMENNSPLGLPQYREDVNFVMVSCQNTWVFVSSGASVFPKSCHYMFNKVIVL